MLQHRAKVAEKVGSKNLEIVKKMGTKNFQNGGPNPPKSSPEGAKKEPGHPKNRKKRQIQQKAPLAHIASPYFKRKSGQHGSKLASQTEAKSKKNRCKNRSKKRCILESIFGRILVDFWRQNGGTLAPKSIKNRCQLRITIFWKNLVFPRKNNDFDGSRGRSWR